MRATTAGSTPQNHRCSRIQDSLASARYRSTTTHGHAKDELEADAREAARTAVPIAGCPANFAGRTRACALRAKFLRIQKIEN
jgi:hypothetical protein